MTNAGRLRCKEAGIPWLDLSGNADIRTGDLYIKIEGKPNQYKKRGRPKNPFAPKSSRIVRLLLSHPGERLFHKNIVKQAGVSKALVSQVIGYLENQGFVRRLDNESVEPVTPENLLAEWKEHYSLQNHKISKGHLYSPGQGPELVKKLSSKLTQANIEHAFTGLASAWHYAPVSSFRSVQVFIEKPLGPDELQEIGISLEPRGSNVWLIEPNDSSVFWNENEFEGVNFVSILQTYLDLTDQIERSKEAQAEIHPLVFARNMT